jgi:hypothetical protein
MRPVAKAKLGFYLLPPTEADRIRRFLRFPENSCVALDPCIGVGNAFARDNSQLKPGLLTTQL